MLRDQAQRGLALADKPQVAVAGAVQAVRPAGDQRQAAEAPEACCVQPRMPCADLWRDCEGAAAKLG
jgi:hypothetical protein